MITGIICFIVYTSAVTGFFGIVSSVAKAGLLDSFNVIYVCKPELSLDTYMTVLWKNGERFTGMGYWQYKRDKDGVWRCAITDLLVAKSLSRRLETARIDYEKVGYRDELY